MKTIFDIFPGIQVYDKVPVEVTNPFSGKTVLLDPEEVAVYDYIKGSEFVSDYKEVRKGLDWFSRKNPEAYMILLD